MTCAHEFADVECAHCGESLLTHVRSLDLAARAALGYVVAGDARAAEHELRFATSPEYARENAKNPPKRAMLFEGIK